MQKNTYIENIKQEVIRHYECCLINNTDQAQQVGWKDKKSQFLRFQILSEIADLNNKSILDVGCGLGEFYNYLNLHRINVKYHGIDLSDKFIEKAKSLYPDGHFEQSDILTKYNKKFDYIISSGIFNVKNDLTMSYFTIYIKKTIKKMYDLCIQGVAFNMITTYVDFKVDSLYYSDPCKVFKFCKKITPYVVLRHDYPLFEYTIYLFKGLQ